MEEQISDLRKDDDLDSASRQYEEGVILSANDAQKLIDYIKGN